MLESLHQNGAMEYKKLTAEEQEARGILGRLYGPCADFKRPTRNGRAYGEKLWENVFSSPIMQERISNLCCFGELGHPADRTEVDMEKVAISLPEVPKKGSDGRLYAIFDILNTPNGRILKALCDYGCAIGVSSRGTGDITEDFSGNSTVDPDTYDCECFDAVLLPAVKEARMTVVTESLNTGKTLSQRLAEELEKAPVEMKSVMTETIEKLKKDYNLEEGFNIDVAKEEPVADNVGTSVISELQEALVAKQELETQLLKLQEKLSVSYAKEITYEEKLAKHQKALDGMAVTARTANALKIKSSALEEELQRKDKTIQELNKQMNELKESLKSSTMRNKALNESLVKERAKKTQSVEDARLLNESFEKQKEEFIREKTSLVESLEELKKDSEIARREYSNKLSNANSLVEKYQKIAQRAVDKYIDLQAVRIGVTSAEIKNRLAEKYSYSDIDKVCESLQQQSLNFNNLPFETIKRITPKSVKITESKQTLVPTNDADDVDSQLLQLANIK